MPARPRGVQGGPRPSTGGGVLVSRGTPCERGTPEAGSRVKIITKAHFGRARLRPPFPAYRGPARGGREARRLARRSALTLGGDAGWSGTGRRPRTTRTGRPPRPR